MSFALIEYTGTGLSDGEVDDSFRPVGSDGLPPGTDRPIWAAIDLRPPGQATGFGLASVEDGFSLGRKIADAPDERLPNNVRRRLGNDLGLNLDATRLRSIIAEILIDHARTDGLRWKPLRADRRTGWMRISIRGEEVWALAPVSGGAEFTESFDQPDSTTLGPVLNWTEIEGNLQTVNNRLRLVSGGTPSTARADHDTATDDHLAEIVLVTAARATSSSNLLIPIARVPSDGAMTGYAFRRMDTSANGVQHRLERLDAGATTVLAGPTSEAFNLPETLRVEADGSTIKAFIGAVEKHSVTDTNITGNTRGAVRIHQTSFSPPGDITEGDSFRVADLAAGGQTINVGTASEIDVAQAVTPRKSVALSAATQRDLAKAITSSAGFERAEDSFDRVESNGWGTADEGGDWTPNGNDADFACDGAVATQLQDAASQTRHAVLDSVSIGDLDAKIKVKTDKLNSGGSGQYSFISFRFQDHQNYYRAQLQFADAGEVRLGIQAFWNDGTQNTTDVVLPTTIARETHAVNTFFWLRVQAIGASPTTLRAKVWEDGTPEPAAWDISEDDSTVGLQQAGAVGVRTFLGGGTDNTPITFSFDDLLVEAPGVAVGTATEQSAAQAVAPSKTAAVGTAIETHIAQTVTPSKAPVVGTAIEGNAAQAISPVRTVAVGTATQRDAAQQLTPAKVAQVAAATEAAASQQIAPAKTAEVLAASEHNLARAVSAGQPQVIEVGTATEGSAAKAVAPAKAAQMTAAVSRDLAQALTPAKQVPIGTATDVSIAASVTGLRTVAVGAAGETQISQAITPTKAAEVASATERDLGLPVSTAGGVPLGTATEGNGAQDIIPARVGDIATAVEADLAQPIDVARIVALGPATATDAAQAVEPSKAADIAAAADSSTAQPIGIPKLIGVVSSSERNAALPVVPVRSFDVGTAIEQANAQAITSLKIIALGAATEHDLAGDITGPAVAPEFVSVAQGRWDISKTTGIFADSIATGRHAPTVAAGSM